MKNLENKSETKIATHILKNIMQFRRMMSSNKICSADFCEPCSAPHLQKIISLISQNKPITFVLPAFPGKSPNPAKVLGPLPDKGEQIALNFLNDLCNRVREYYAPGAKLILCSDGRVFGDVIGMNEDDITTYQSELERMIQNSSFTNLSIFTLDAFWKTKDFSEKRHQLMEQYSEALEVLQERVRNGNKEYANSEEEESHRIYCGITRFLVEDSMHPGQQKSRNAIQKDCRVKAYEVIRRSNAWSNLISEYFPEAVRLSIHPQTCGAKKLGIKLIETNENWMTPWHGVAVETAKGFVLMKRSEAENLGAQIIQDETGRASHYKLAA